MLEISVVLPVFNGEQHLPAALASIAAQTRQPLEVVAIDDGSTDRTGEILRGFGARVIQIPRGGQAAARNLGLETAAGDAIAFIDHDDRWRPAKLERQAAMLEADPDLAFVGALSAMFLADGAEPPPWWKTAWDHGVPEPSLLPSATLYRRSAFAVAGVYATGSSVTISEDIDWTARAQDLGLRRAVVDEVLVDKRVHASNISNVRSVMIREHLAIARASIERKRAGDA